MPDQSMSGHVHVVFFTKFINLSARSNLNLPLQVASTTFHTVLSNNGIEVFFISWLEALSLPVICHSLTAVPM